MNRIPNHRIDRSKAVEEAARLKDVTDRAKAARPIDTGRDILYRPLDGMRERFGFPADSRYLKD
jgi:hypothetical protein